MERTLGELAALLGGRLQGPADLVIQGIAAIDCATSRDITFISQKRFAHLATQSQAAAFIVGDNQTDLGRPSIIVPHPYLAYAQVAALFAPPRPHWSGVSPLAFLRQRVEMGQEVSIFPLAYIGNDVRLGERVTIMPGCFLGDQVQVGDDTLLYPNVTILERCKLGQRVIVHSGTVIGADGFGFVPGKEGHYKIPQLGTVVIEDDVEIGANCTIDRAALEETRVEQGVKIDNLVHLAHNVTVGAYSFLVAQAGVAGSTKLGKRVVLGGQAGLVGHIKLGDGVQVAAQTGVTHSIPANQTVIGSPARAHQEFIKFNAILPKLPEIYKRLKELERKMAELAANPAEEHQK